MNKKTTIIRVLPLRNQEVNIKIMKVRYSGGNLYDNKGLPFKYRAHVD